MTKIMIDGTEYDTDTMSKQAQNTLVSVRFVDQQLQMKAHELNIAKTAQAAYAAALKKELGQSGPVATSEGEN